MGALSTLTATIETKLNAITSVSLVTNEAETWNGAKPQDYDKIYYQAEITDQERLCFPSTAGNDMTAYLNVTVIGAIRAQYTTSVDTNLETLRVGVDTKMLDTTSLGSNVIECLPESYEPDKGIVGKHGWFTSVYNLKYLYSHLSP